MSRPTLLFPSVVAAAAGVAGTLWSARVSSKAAARSSALRFTGAPSYCQPEGRAGE